MITPHCKGVIGWLFGHSFRDINDYSETMPRLSLPINLGYFNANIVKESKQFTYTFRGAYCPRCGASFSAINHNDK